MSQRRPRSWQEMREQEIKWLPKRTFNARVPSTKTRSDLGLRRADDVDDEVVGWIKRSYAENI